MWGNLAYKGQTAVIRNTRQMRRTSPTAAANIALVGESEKARNRTKSKVRAKVEHSE